MPVYLFRCRGCGETLDVYRNFDSVDNDFCVCGGELRRVYSVGGVTFKGNGFYRTDNRAKED